VNLILKPLWIYATVKRGSDMVGNHAQDPIGPVPRLQPSGCGTHHKRQNCRRNPLQLGTRLADGKIGWKRCEGSSYTLKGIGKDVGNFVTCALISPRNSLIMRVGPSSSVRWKR
jgi:hypothetical protein